MGGSHVALGAQIGTASQLANPTAGLAMLSVVAPPMPQISVAAIPQMVPIAK
jgi:hypothetical protein